MIAIITVMRGHPGVSHSLSWALKTIAHGHLFLVSAQWAVMDSPPLPPSAVPGLGGLRARAFTHPSLCA